MSELPYVAMNGYNEKGMTGACREAARGVAVGIGYAIGKDAGAVIAGAAFSYFEDDIFGKPEPKKPVFSPSGNFSGGLRGVSNGMARSTAFQAAILEKWFNNKFQPWQKAYFTDLSDLSDEEFKNDINDKLLNLEAIRLMYKSENIKKDRVNGMASPSTDYDIPKISDIETKAEAFKYLTDMIRDIFLKTMSERGRTPKEGIKMKTVKNFKPESYENLDAPEDIEYEGGAKTDVDIYVFSENDTGGVDIEDTDNSTLEEKKTGDIEVVKNPENPETIFSSKKQTSLATSIPLLIAGFFGGKYAYNTLTKGNKEKEQAENK